MVADFWVRSSVTMHQLTSANSGHYLHVLQPNQYVLGSKPMGEEERRRAFDPNHRYREAIVKGYPMLRARAERLRSAGVRFLDATQIFADISKPLYHDTCCHFTPEGAQMLGTEMGRFLLLDLRRAGRVSVAPGSGSITSDSGG